MEIIRKNYKLIIGTLIILILTEMAVVYYLITQFHERYIGRDEAVSRFLAEESLAEEDVTDIKVKLRHKKGDAWYEIEYNKDDIVYKTTVEAEKEE